MWWRSASTTSTMRWRHLGTATTSDHIHTLFRTTAEVVCCYDGDNAGREAAWRALDNALSHLQDGRELKFVFCRMARIPTRWYARSARRGSKRCSTRPSRLRISCSNASGRDAALSGEAGKFEVANKAAELIRRVPEGFTREGLITRLSSMMRWEKQAADCRAVCPQQPAQGGSQQTKATKLTPIRRALAPDGAVSSDHRRAAGHARVGPAAPAGDPFLLQLHQQILIQPGVTTGILLEHWRSTKEGEILPSWRCMTCLKR